MPLSARPLLIQIIAFCLLGAKAAYELTMIYFQIGP